MIIYMKYPRIRWGALSLLAVWLSGCASYYTPKSLYLEDPALLPIHVKVPDTQVSVGIIFLDSSKLVHFFFTREGLIRQDILPVLISINSKDKKIYSATPRSFYFEADGRVYKPISPEEVFDVAWQSKHPYILVKKTLYYGALTIFTIATLGLGSMIWVLPTPFKQPTPSDDPFGRDLVYKSFPKKAIVQPGIMTGGMIFFHMTAKMKDPSHAAFVIHLAQETSSFAVHSASVTIRTTNQEDSQNAIDVLENFFNY